ncbi:dnaJ protein ERDJ2-like [Iris pallida]|uniref:DnaJ protein ERDJ2-like n=1 Tax=Iris pallida TaxID=29817 RepID=A0AAX6FRG6_IRIPA|nr:dnaJ protein ERDJ2-like [Iris pallida]
MVSGDPRSSRALSNCIPCGQPPIYPSPLCSTSDQRERKKRRRPSLPIPTPRQSNGDLLPRHGQAAERANRASWRIV